MEKLYGSLSQEFQLNGTLQNEEVFNGNLANEVLRGYSAYQVAVLNGFIGTEQEWLDSLKYQHSTELSELASQVRNDAIQVNNDKLQVSKDKQTIELKAQEVNSSALSVSKDKSHIDKSVTEFNNKVTQANTTIDTKVEQASASATQAENAKNIAIQNATKIEQSASQIEQNKNDILNFSIKNKASGNPCVITDSQDYELLDLKIYGQSEQVTTTGKNLLDIKGLTDVKNGEITINDNHIECVLNNNYDGNYIIFSKEFPAGDYVFSYIRTKNGDAQKRFCKMIVSKPVTGADCNYNSYYKNYLVINYGNYNFIKFNATESFKIGFPLSGDRNDKPKDIVRVQNVQLEKGTTQTSYEPYSNEKASPSIEYPQNITSNKITNIKVMGKNLLGGRIYYTNYNGGKVYLINENTVSLPYIPNWEPHGIGYVVPCKKGVTYTLSVTNPNENAVVGITEYCNFESAKNFTNCYGSTDLSENRVSYTARTNGVLVCCIAGKWTNGTTTLHTCTDTELLQLEYSSNQTPYEPYKEQIIPLSTPIELCGLKSSQGNVIINGQPYISDVVKDKNGVIGIERNVGNIPSYTNEQITEPFMSSTGQLTQGANVVYKQTPTFEPLPQNDQDAIRKLKTNYPNTIVDCGVFVETEYCADTKLYIDQSIAKYHAQAQANQVAMMSLLPDETQATMIEKDQANLLKGV